MQEFSSVTASSYDADALAPLLSQKSAEGWDVISIVSAGTNIVAYLSRESSSAEEDTGEIDTPAFVEAQVAEAEIADADTASADDGPVGADGAEDVVEIETVDDEIEVPADSTPVAAAVAAEPVLPEASAEEVPPSEAIVVGTPADAVEEPAGWGAAPEETATPDEASVEDLAAQVSEPEPEPVVAAAAAAEPAPVESTVPAGWYADPSGRYELRYWDGNAWTEHVSRAGQQFTDPPVA